jgi:hypothetical protein
VIFDPRYFDPRSSILDLLPNLSRRGRMEIVVGGKSSRVSDAIPELDLEQLESIIEGIVKRVVGAPRGLRNIREFARANNIGLTLAYEELNSGRLEAVKLGPLTMVTPEAQAAWIARLPRYTPADATNELETA